MLNDAANGRKGRAAPQGSSKTGPTKAPRMQGLQTAPASARDQSAAGPSTIRSSWSRVSGKGAIGSVTTSAVAQTGLALLGRCLGSSKRPHGVFSRANLQMNQARPLHLLMLHI